MYDEKNFIYHILDLNESIIKSKIIDRFSFFNGTYITKNKEMDKKEEKRLRNNLTEFGKNYVEEIDKKRREEFKNSNKVSINTNYLEEKRRSIQNSNRRN